MCAHDSLRVGSASRDEKAYIHTHTHREREVYAQSLTYHFVYFVCAYMIRVFQVCAVASNVTFSNMCFYSCADEHDTKDGFMPGECNAASSNGSQTEIDDNGDNENAAPWWCFWCSLEIELPAIFTFSRQQQR